MQADRHHFRRRRALFVERIEGVLQIGVELVAAVEALGHGEAHVVGVERVGHDEMRPVHHPAPERQIVGIIVGVVNEAALPGDQPAGVGAGPAGIPAERPLAGNPGLDLDGAGHMLALHLLRHAVIVDPAIAVGADLVAVLQHFFGDVRMPFQRHGDGEDGEREMPLAKQVEDTPDSGAGAVFVDRLHRHVARALERRGADNLGQEGLGGRIAVQDAVFAALLVVQHELDGDPCTAQPMHRRRRAPVADQVAVVSGRPGHWAFFLPRPSTQAAICRRSVKVIPLTLLGGIAVVSTDCR